MTRRKRKFKWSSKGIPAKNAQLGRKPLMPSFWPPLLPGLFPSFFWCRGHSPSPSFLTPVLSHFLNTIRERWLMHLLAKLPKPGLLGSRRARRTTHAHPGNSWTERSGARAPGPWNHPTTAPPASANQVPSRSIMQISLRAPASQEPRPPPPSVLFHPSRAEVAAASPATGAPPIFPSTCAWKKKLKWFLGVTWEGSGRVWPGRRRRASAVALGAFPVAIRNRLEMLSNLPRPHFASGKQKSSGEQTTFEYFLQASRLQASGLCFLPNTLNSQ